MESHTNKNTKQVDKASSNVKVNDTKNDYHCVNGYSCVDHNQIINLLESIDKAIKNRRRTKSD